MSEACKVVFYGELQEGFDPEQVLQAFSDKFGVSREKAIKLPNARPAAWNIGFTGSIPRYPASGDRSGK